MLFNPLETLGRVSSSQEICIFILEIVQFITLYFENDPLCSTTFSFALSTSCCSLIFLVKASFPNRTFQNIYGLEIFWAFIWLMLVTLRSFLFKNDEYQKAQTNNDASNRNSSVVIFVKVFLCFIASFWAAHYYSQWFYSFQELSLKTIMGWKSSSQEKMSFAVNFSHFNSRQNHISMVSSRRFTLQIYTLINFVIQTNGGDFKHPNLSFLPFLSNPYKSRSEEKLMFLKGLESEHKESCMNVNCRCRSILTHKNLRLSKSENDDLRILDSSFFIQLSVIREIIHAFLQRSKFSKSSVLLYSYFMTNFQNRLLFSSKLVFQNLMKTSIINGQRNSFSDKKFGGEGNFEAYYFQYFQIKQMQNKVLKN